MPQERKQQLFPETNRLFTRARILYIEDDTGLGHLTRKRLERMAYIVDVAQDGQQGITMFTSGSYDIVITDYNMPVVDGIEVLRNLKDLIPVIILTGQGDEKVAVDAMKLGAADYVSKDVNGEYIEFLPSIIDRVMERQQLIKDRQKALDELQASEARYRAIVEDLTEMICRFQSDGKLTFANTAFCRYFGIRHADVVFQKLAIILSRNTYQRMKEILNTLTPNDPVKVNVYNIKLAEGEVRWVQWISRAIYEDTGKVREYQLVGRDITELMSQPEQNRQG